MTVTAKDIARQLQLSQPTVSRILNGDPNHRCSKETRQRVLDAAKRMRYQPNAVARSLRRGRTDVIGLYTNFNYDARNDFFGTVLGALQRGAERYRLDVLVHSGLHGRPVDDIHAKLRDGRVDGLILHAAADDPLIPILEHSSLPVVVIADPVASLPSVTSDDAGGMLLAIDYLWTRGYRKFAFLAPETYLGSVERRRTAFETDLALRGVPTADRPVVRIDFEEVDLAVDDIRNLQRGTAVCCWNDRTAYRLLTLCMKLGIKIPEDIAIVGFDGFLSEKAPARKLVTVLCPWVEVVDRALDVLIRMVTREISREEAKELQLCLPVTMIDGDTV
jgi:DNA-binding LacI/PurR family transcriptional regulator